jgi:hypothetical protein
MPERADGWQRRRRARLTVGEKERSRCELADEFWDGEELELYVGEIDVEVQLVNVRWYVGKAVVRRTPFESSSIRGTLLSSGPATMKRR